MLSNIQADFSTIPAEMKALKQWVCWYFVERGGKATKIPFSPITNTNAKSNDASTWTNYELAYQFANEHELFTGENKTSTRGGIGFMFANGYCGVDLDHVIDEAGNLKPFAADIVNTLDSYTEYSPSGTGLHIFIRINEPLASIGDRNKVNFDDNSDIEIYDHERYFTVTGNPYGELKPINERTEALKIVYSRHFPAKKPEREKKSTSRAAPSVNANTPTNNTMTDADFRVLIKKISSSKQGEKFKALFNGNTAAYNLDDSRADAALCEILSWWTGGNAGYIDFVFRKSMLYRPKWDELRGSETYGQITINNAIESYRLHQSEHDANTSENMTVFDKRDEFLRGRNLLFHGSIRGGVWYSYNSEKGFWVTLTDADIHADVSNHFQHHEKPRAVADIVTSCRLMVTKPIRPKFNIAPLMSFRNGVLELDTGNFRPAKPDDYLTWQVGYDYNPVATCENFDRFIWQVTQGERTRIKFLDCIGGYILFTDCRLEKCFFLLGEGGNGKSVYLKILDSIFASVNEQEHSRSVTHIQPKDFSEATKVVMLENAIANIAYDIKPDLKGTEEVFKSLVSGETITGNLKFHDTRSFTPRAKIICSCNSIPLFDDSSAGLARRPLFCDFNVRFFPPDTRLLQKLMTERSGIFNRFYRAYRELIDREQKGEQEIIPPSRDQEERLREFMTAANPVLEYWLARSEGLYQYAGDNGGKISKQYVYDDFCEWCGKTKLTPYPATVFHRKFQSTLRSQGVPFQGDRNSGHRGESYYQFFMSFDDIPTDNPAQDKGIPF